MPNPREVSEPERQAIWAEVVAEFPDDEMMREIHFVRAYTPLNSVISPKPSAWNI